MTELLYYKDAYLKSIEATVIEQRDGGFILDRTIFYPECGGQPGDRGSFGSFRVKDTQKGDDGTPIHIASSLPPVGTKEILSLDWEFRHFHMAEHTAQHLLSSILYNSHGIGTVAVHQGEDILTIETDRCDIPESILLAVEEEAVRRVGENRRVWMEEMSHEKAEALGMRRSIKVEGDVKVVFIDSLDAVACGGVHLASTGEIGEVIWCGSEMIRGHVRTLWRIGRSARRYRREALDAARKAGALLSTDISGIADGIGKLREEIAEERRKTRAMEETMGRNLLLSELKGGKAAYISPYSIDTLPQVVSALGNDVEIFVIDREKNTFVYFGRKETFDTIKGKGLVRGGGRPPMWRGQLLSGQEETIAALKKEIGIPE